MVKLRSGMNSSKPDLSGYNKKNMYGIMEKDVIGSRISKHKAVKRIKANSNVVINVTKPICHTTVGSASSSSVARRRSNRQRIAQLSIGMVLM